MILPVEDIFDRAKRLITQIGQCDIQPLEETISLRPLGGQSSGLGASACASATLECGREVSDAEVMLIKWATHLTGPDKAGNPDVQAITENGNTTLQTTLFQDTFPANAIKGKVDYIKDRLQDWSKLPDDGYFKLFENTSKACASSFLREILPSEGVREVYVTPEGTVLLKDIYPGTGSS